MTALPPIPPLFDLAPRFHGPADSADLVLDTPRLRTLQGRVTALMADGSWRTLAEIRAAVGAGSETGISARLRDARRAACGGWNVERRRRGTPAAGLWEYRLSSGVYEAK